MTVKSLAKGKNRKNAVVNMNSSSEIEKMVSFGLTHGGIHVVARKGHGKTRLLFWMARISRKLKAKTIIFDGSETWLYGFDKIPTFTVKERDIVSRKPKTIEEIEHYEVKNWELVQYVLEHYNAVLFRLKTRKPSKRGFFIRKVVNWLDLQQREARRFTEDNEAKVFIAYFIEEAQNCFTSRSTARLEAEEFVSVFNEARNQKEAFFTASQRLTDFSKTIRTKQAYCIGKIAEEDKSLAIRRIERKYNIDFSKMKARTWFFNGKTIRTPTFKQKGKPYIINKEVEKALAIEQHLTAKEEPKKSLWDRIKEALIKHETYSEDLLEVEEKELEDDDSFEDSETEIEDDFGVYDDEDEWEW